MPEIVTPARPQDLDIFTLIPTRQKLAQMAADGKAAYAQAEPFPHIYLDNFLPESVADDVLAAFPNPKGISWQEFKNEREKKLASGDETAFPPVVRNVLAALNSATFLRFLEDLTGIPNLMADPDFTGGGLHQIMPGGKLGVHVDFNKHKRFKIDRRLNLLIYLNKDWQEEFGGHFELWSRDGQKCLKRILPLFNRCLVFSTSEYSYHGHPQPLTCPADRTRKSLALYYYTNGRDDDAKGAAPHTSVFVDLPEERKFGRRIARKFKTTVRALTPPLLYNLASGNKV
jgi:Rps23 Pro-64 3,4-dihydroxylase Tpa1-like proline 4-hydroxylase